MNCNHYRKIPPRRSFIRDSVAELEEIHAVDIRPHPKRPGKWIGYDRHANPVGRPPEGGSRPKTRAEPIVGPRPNRPSLRPRSRPQQPDPPGVTPLPAGARTWWLIQMATSEGSVRTLAFETEDEARTFSLAPGDPPRRVLRTVLLREPPLGEDGLRVIPAWRRAS